jgi:hypothetical protein
MMIFLSLGKKACQRNPCGIKNVKHDVTPVAKVLRQNVCSVFSHSEVT